MSDAIVIKSVTKTFGPKIAVKDLDLVVPAGSLCGFIGPNGAGKTTTIRMIMSIIFPDSGTISVLGRPSAIESKDRIGYLPEERGIYRKMRVASFLTYIARLKGIDASAATVKVREWLGRVGLEREARKKCEELSKGMQQKVQFIAAVIHEPDLLILDEVFSGLDPVNRRLMRDLISEQSSSGRTIVFSTHAMYEAEQLCDRIFMIHKGVKTLDMPLEAVWSRHDPRTIIVEAIDQSIPGLEARVNLPGIRSFKPTDHGFELHLEDRADPATLMSSLAQVGRLRRIELKRPSLEDIFIELVGDADALNAPKEAIHAPGAPVPVAS